MFHSEYVAKKPDTFGHVSYTDAENSVWRDLYARQIQIVQGRGCDEYLRGIEILNMPHDRIPQLDEMNAALEKASSWHVAPVNALIPQHEFFSLLAARKFPAATFIRSRKDFDYIKEPDIFHEFFGHCPMLTHPTYADFMQKFAELAITKSEAEQIRLARLYWYTVEFGLIETAEGLRIYGGGILSSPEETVYALESPVPQRIPLDLEMALNTDFQIDIKQPLYFIIHSFKQLYHLIDDLG